MAYELTIMKDGRLLRRQTLAAGASELGRRPHNAIVLDAPTVSARHARLQVDEVQIAVADLGSSNGTWLNGSRLQPGSDYLLQPGDSMAVGPFRLALQAQSTGAARLPAAAGAGGEQAHGAREEGSAAVPAAAAGLPNGPRGPALRALLTVTSGADTGQRLELCRQVNTLGAPGAGLLSITSRAGGYAIMRQDSGGQATLNGVVLATGSSAPLLHGDAIVLDGVAMRFRLEPL